MAGGIEGIVIEIGGIPIRFFSNNADFDSMLMRRYAGFLSQSTRSSLDVEVILTDPQRSPNDDPLVVCYRNGEWLIRRGDFEARWSPIARRATLRQSINPWSCDSALRVLHSLMLAESDGFLLHAAGVISTNGAALFSGVSGAGKSTIAGLAPNHVQLLTDEISYIRKVGDTYHAWGTPFTGELNMPGKNVSASIRTLYFLAHGSDNRLVPIAPQMAVRRLLRNILFFASKPDLVSRVLNCGCAFVETIPAYELIFRPDAEVWRLVA
jgi:hypothetical protein